MSDNLPFNRGLGFSRGGVPVFFQDSWWDTRRTNILKEVMLKYNDLEKASHVLGCPFNAVKNRWERINKI